MASVQLLQELKNSRQVPLQPIEPDEHDGTNLAATRNESAYLHHDGQQWLLSVDATRLHCDSGDLARGLEVDALERGFAWRVRMIGGHRVLIVGAVKEPQSSHFMAMRCHVLIPLEDYSGTLLTPAQAQSRPDAQEGILLDTGFGPHVICAEAKIIPADRLA